MFQKNMRVTICNDREGRRARRIGIVKRIGVGAWRLEGCSEWYDFEGRRVAVDCERFKSYAETTCFARPYEDGDEDLIRIEDRRLENIRRLTNEKVRREQAINNLKADTQYAMRVATQRLHNAEAALRFANAELHRAQSEFGVATADENRSKDTIAAEEAQIAKLDEEIKSME